MRDLRSLVSLRAASPTVLALPLALLLGSGCNSGGTDAPAPTAEATATIPEPLPSDPYEALDVLLEAEFDAHFGDPAQRAASSQRITEAINAAMARSDDPARFAAVQAAAATMSVNPTAGTYRAVGREWTNLRSRL